MNAEKSEVCSFSTWSNDSSWNPTIFIGNRKVRVNPTPRLLSVILDRSLTFNAHLKKLTTSLASSISIIKATTHTSWGWHRSTLKMVFHALVRSKPGYAAPAWQSWLSDINLSSLDCLQIHSLRLITGQLIFTPLEALRLEADVQSYTTCSKRFILKVNEKALRSTDNHPKRIALGAKNASKVALVSVEKLKNSRLSCHLVSNTDKTSLIFHLHHGSKALLSTDEFPPLFPVLLVEPIITT